MNPGRPSNPSGGKLSSPKPCASKSAGSLRTRPSLPEEPPRILIVGKLPDALPASLQAKGFTSRLCPTMTEALDIGVADAIVTSSDVEVSGSSLAGLKGLKAVGRAAGGVDNIDLAAARDLGVAVFHTPLATAPAAAELTIGLILCLLRRINDLSEKLKNGVWGKYLLTEELAGKTLGIVGLGRVGSRVCRFARAFGMTVIACDPYIPESRFRRFKAAPRALVDLLRESDVVTFHVPLNSETRGMIGRDRIRLMRRGAYLINCARGAVVDDEALHEALVSGQLAGVAIDTWNVEPGGSGRLLALPTVLGTPHTGGATRQAKARIVEMLTRSLEDFFQGRKIPFRLV